MGLDLCRYAIGCELIYLGSRRRDLGEGGKIIDAADWIPMQGGGYINARNCDKKTRLVSASATPPLHFIPSRRTNAYRYHGEIQYLSPLLG